MRTSHEGLSLWYRTADAFAPEDDEVVPRAGARLLVGVSPLNPLNAVHVRYRVDGGSERTLAAHEQRSDFARDAQYFAVNFPPFATGDLVEYEPVLSCTGRQVPALARSTTFPARFRLAPDEQPGAERTQPGPRHPARLERLACAELVFQAPQYIGETPAGVRVNFFVREGQLQGDGWSARVLPGSCDHLLVRRDGVGVIRVRTALETHDGATLDVEAGGYIELGPDGYRSVLARSLPAHAPFVMCPELATLHPKYRWLSLVQCVASGAADLTVPRISYEIYRAGGAA